MNRYVEPLEARRLFSAAPTTEVPRVMLSIPVTWLQNRPLGPARILSMPEVRSRMAAIEAFRQGSAILPSPLEAELVRRPAATATWEDGDGYESSFVASNGASVSFVWFTGIRSNEPLRVGTADFDLFT